MLRPLYQALLAHPATRRRTRHLRAKVQRAAGYSDPYFDVVAATQQANATLFLDIGCYHGRTLQRFFDAGLSCPVVAFDPIPENVASACALLAHEIRKGHIQFERTALSDEDGSARFYINRNKQTSSLLENAEGNRQSFAEDTRHVCEVEVPVARLDTWLTEGSYKSPTIVIKCDAQGAEARVVRGGLRTLREHTAAFYGEIMLGPMYEGQASFDEMRSLLEGGCGMVLKNIYPCLHDSAGRAVQMDALWVKPDLLFQIKEKFLEPGKEQPKSDPLHLPKKGEQA